MTTPDKIIASFRCESDGMVGSKDAPIHSVVVHDDGVIEVVIDYWPEQAAEIGRVRTELIEADAVAERLRNTLNEIAAALKGPPPDGVWHSWHDLPEKAAQLVEALKKVAQSLEWYAHGRCRGFDDGAPLPTNEAVELAERTLAKVRA